MSTRSCIIVKVRKEDIGKEIKFDKQSLPVPLDNWESKDIDGKVWRDETGRNLCLPVKIDSQYIGIYCHWDGYPSGVGVDLKEHFKDYKSALNLVIGGSCSALGSKVRHYANRQGERWQYLKPKQGKTLKELVAAFIHADAEYAYLYDETRGEWVYKPLYGVSEKVHKRGFKLMK